MNCSPNISIALSLLSLTAGVWFLYKTQKENLGILYKVAAWFIIIATILNMACCGLRCIAHGCMMRQQCEMNMGNCEMGMGECRMGNGMCNMGGGMMMHKRMMICKDDDDDCKMGGGKCCDMPCCQMNGGKGCEMGEGECMEGKEGKMDCCKDGGKEKCDMKMMMKKDSVIKKK